MVETAESAELTDRYRFLVVEYKKLSIDLAKHLENYGRVRKELQILLEEFSKRNINIEEIDVLIENEEHK